MNKLKAVPRATLSEQAALQLLDMMTAEQWKTGQKLPSEFELCQSLSVGRSTLREALKSLAFIGLLRMRPGEGTFVAEGSRKFLERILSCGLLNTERKALDLSETRIALEVELVGHCAQRGSEEDFRRIEDILGEMQRAPKSGLEHFAQLDVDFHLTIASASQNRLLADLLLIIRGLLKEYISKNLRVPGSVEMTCKQHLEILEAVRGRDPQRARTAMRRHLETFQQRYGVLLKGSKSVPSTMKVST